MRRCFSPSQKLHLLRLAGYRCQNCGIPLTPENATADHRIPYTKQGATQVWNGQALCMQCNAKKGDQTVTSIRRQRAEGRGQKEGERVKLA